MNPLVICQITRGLAVARSVVNAVENARDLGVPYRLIDGLRAVEAKLEAVEEARTRGFDLLLVEDDIVATRDHWRDAAESETITIAPAKMRGGVLNTDYFPDGTVRNTGSCFLKIPLEVIRRFDEELREPLFRAWSYRKTSATTHESVGPHPDGRGSDIWFFHHVYCLDPVPTILELLPIQHFMHEGSSEYLTPSKLVAY